MSPSFIKGLELGELFYIEVVRPILALHLPHLVYSTGLLGQGSDVLGFDTPCSRLIAARLVRELMCLGSLDQFVDSMDAKRYLDRLKAIYV